MQASPIVLPKVMQQHQNSAKIISLLPIQTINSNVTPPSLSIVSVISTTTHSPPYPLTCIWEDDKVEKYKDYTGEKQMRCLWCNQSFNSWHASRMISHVLKLPKGALGACFQMRDINCSKVSMTKMMQGRRENRSVDELMTALTNQNDAAASLLT